MKKLMIAIWMVMLVVLPSLAQIDNSLGLSKSRTGLSGGDIQETITTIVSTRATYPNQYIAPSEYDIINMADDGTTIRYGYTDSVTARQDSVIVNAFTVLTDGGAVDYYGSSANNNNAFIWFSLNGVNAGDRIEECLVHLNYAAFGGCLMGDASYYTVRVDTLTSDYACVTDNPSTLADPCRMDISHNYVDDSASTAWSPPLNQRFNGYQYGPRATTMLGYGDIVHDGGDDNNDGQRLIFDITNAVQQIADRGQEYIDRGLLLTPYHVGSQQGWNISAGNSATYVGGTGEYSGKGNPALTIRTNSKRGTTPWDTPWVPVVLMTDDSWPAQADFYEGLDGDNFPYEMAVSGADGYWNASSDSLYTANSNRISLFNHSATHVAAGALTGAALDSQVTRDWMTSSVFTTMPDTSNLAMSWVWPGVSPIYSMEALAKVTAYGHRSGRGTSGRTFAECPIGDILPLSWDNYCNIFAHSSTIIGGLLGGGVGITDKDAIRENLLIYVELATTWGGRGPAVFYGHNFAMDGLSEASLTALREVIDETFFLKRMAYKDIITRVRARGFVDVADVEIVANNRRGLSFEDSVKYTKPWQTAARQDSFATHAGTSAALEAAMDEQWVGPVNN